MHLAMKNGRTPFNPKDFEDFKRAAAMGPVEFARRSIPMDANAELTPQQALRLALAHIEHMSAWIAAQKAGYSFESLGEDMPGMRAAVAPGERS
jgi:hypothetical protein